MGFLPSGSFRLLRGRDMRRDGECWALPELGRDRVVPSGEGRTRGASAEQGRWVAAVTTEQVSAGVTDEHSGAAVLHL